MTKSERRAAYPQWVNATQLPKPERAAAMSWTAAAFREHRELFGDIPGMYSVEGNAVIHTGRPHFGVVDKVYETVVSVFPEAQPSSECVVPNVIVREKEKRK